MKVYYRGTKKGETKRIKTGIDAWDNNLFCLKLEKLAKWYGSNIEIIIAKPEAKVITEGTKEFKKEFGETKENQSLLDWGVFVITKAKKLGYQIVEFERQGDIGTVIIDKSSVIRNAIIENDITSFIKQFNVSREIAIREIAEISLEEYKKSEKEMEEVYDDIIRDSYPL